VPAPAEGCVLAEVGAARSVSPVPRVTPTPLRLTSAAPPTAHGVHAPNAVDRQTAEDVALSPGDLGPRTPTQPGRPAEDFNGVLGTFHAYCDYYTPVVARCSGHRFVAYRTGGVAVGSDVSIFTGTGAADLVEGVRRSLRTCKAPLTVRDARGTVLGVFAVTAAPAPSTVPTATTTLTYRRIDVAGPVTRAVFLQRGRVLSVVLTTGTESASQRTLRLAVKRAALRLARAPAS